MTQLFNAGLLQAVAGSMTPQMPAGWYPGLYEPSASDGGVFDGYLAQFQAATWPNFDSAMGLPLDKDIIAGPTIPDYVTNLNWMVDNGCYNLRGLPWDPATYTLNGPATQVISPGPCLVGPQGFDPAAPLSNPSSWFGMPGSPLASSIALQGQTLLLATKWEAKILGSTVAASTVLASLGATIGGPIGALASGVAGAVGGTAAGLSGLLGSLSATGVGVIPAIVIGAMMTIMETLLVAFPAEAPGKHITTLPTNYPAPLVTWYLDDTQGGGWSRFCFYNPDRFDQEADNNAVQHWTVPAQTLVNYGVVATIQDITADTFFAGLHYLHVEQIPGTSNSVQFVWMQRHTRAAIAGFKVARAAGKSIADSIRATYNFSAYGAPPYTRTEIGSAEILTSAGGGTPAILDAIRVGNKQALAWLLASHQLNEQKAEAWLASPTFVSSSAFPMKEELRRAAGCAPVSAPISASASHSLTLTPSTHPVTVVRSAPVETPHTMAILASGALCGIAGAAFAPKDYRAVGAGIGVVAGVVLSRFVT